MQLNIVYLHSWGGNKTALVKKSLRAEQHKIFTTVYYASILVLGKVETCPQRRGPFLTSERATTY